MATATFHLFLASLDLLLLLLFAPHITVSPYKGGLGEVADGPPITDADNADHESRAFKLMETMGVRGDEVWEVWGVWGVWEVWEVWGVWEVWEV